MTSELSGGEFWIRFAAASLAVWRMTHLIAYEDGPGDVLFKLRTRVGHGFFGKLMDCFYCVSVWVAAVFAPFVTTRLPDVALFWLALSGAACLLERGTAPAVQVDHSSLTKAESQNPQEEQA